MMRFFLFLAFLAAVNARVINFETDGGAKADDNSWATVWKNGAAMNTTLAQLKPGDTLLVPNKKYYIMGGIQASDLESVTIQIDGTLEYGTTTWDTEKEGPGTKANTLACMTFQRLKNVTFTSGSEYGILNGDGGKWWGIPLIGYLVRAENRPRMMIISASTDVVIEKLSFVNSPYWTFLASGVANLEIRYSKIDNRRDTDDGHDLNDLSAFNTDGFDLSGCHNVWIHDSSVWNQDDCFDVKDGTSDVLIERVNASGFGLTIGSIASNVDNVTFRDSYMHHTHKGIYLKFRGPGLVSNILYENIVMDQPEQFAIWIGPAQQCDGCGATNLCSTDGGPCSICWPTVPGTKCNAPAGGKYVNITLRNITINSPKQSAGVLLANNTSPMENLILDNVVVNNPASTPFGDEHYYCKNVQGKATGTTSPVPRCLEDLTTATLARKAAAQSLLGRVAAAVPAVVPFDKVYGYTFEPPQATGGNTSVPFTCKGTANDGYHCSGVLCTPLAGCVLVRNGFALLPASDRAVCKVWVQEKSCPSLPHLSTRRCHIEASRLTYTDFISTNSELAAPLLAELENRCQ